MTDEVEAVCGGAGRDVPARPLDNRPLVNHLPVDGELHGFAVAVHLPHRPGANIRNLHVVGHGPSLPRLALFALLLSGCASMLGEIPGRVHLADCKRGPAYSYKSELICDEYDTHASYVSRPLEPNDNAGSACVFCDRWGRL